VEQCGAVTSPEVASPDMTSPEVASPEMTSPEITSPQRETTTEKEQQRETTTRKVWIYLRERTTKGDNNQKSMDLLERKNNKGKQQPEKYGFIREKEQQRETTTRKALVYLSFSACCFPLLFFLSSISILF
jgi:hypothetical protein